MLRLVLDTVVFVRALINPQSRSGRILSEYVERYVLIVSKPTAQELLEVIQRPELTKKFKKLDTLAIERIIGILAKAEAVEIGTPSPVVRDPKDDIFVATAIAGGADYLVSEDKDLLSLGSSAEIKVINTETLIELWSAE